MGFVGLWKRRNLLLCSEETEERKSPKNEKRKKTDENLLALDFYDGKSWLSAIADLCLEIYFINFIDVFPTTEISLNRQKKPNSFHYCRYFIKKL